MLHRIFYQVLFAIFMGAVAYAQPTVRVTAAQQENYRYVLFTFMQDNPASMEGCHYNLFAAESVKKIRTLPHGARSIATFFRPNEMIQIIAGSLPHLKRVRRKFEKVYFKVLLSCPEAINGYSEIFNISMKTFANGRAQTVRSLVRSMKYSMQYYNPSDHAP